MTGVSNQFVDTKRPLLGKRVLITRAREQAKELATPLEEQGAVVISFPTIEISPPPDWHPLDQAIERIDQYHWICFTSVNGVKAFIKRLEDKGKGVEVFAGKEVSAIGPRTQEELEARGIKVHLCPAEFRAEAVAEGLKAMGIKGKKILLPRAKGAREVLPFALRGAGALVDEVEAYQVVTPKDHPPLSEVLAQRVDIVVFTSSSTVRHFMDLLTEKEGLNGIKIAVIGPITAQTVREYGLQPNIIPPRYTIPDLVEAIIAYYQNKAQ